MAMALAAAAGLLAGCSGHAHPRSAPPTSHPVPTPAPSTTVAPPTTLVPAGWSLIATTKGAIHRYPSPGTTSDGTIPATWHGGVSALPVIAQQPGWLEVRLATRPNESTAWVRQSDVTLSSTPYRILIDVAARRLELYRLGQKVLDAPVGVGTPSDPTPAGQYFVALFAEPPSSGYGPFVIVTSAHSNTITDWEQSGDALIAIHGPLGADAEIGTTGAAISHGCVRLHDQDLQELRPVPAGTPVTIT